jgi:hypothetical protein
MIRRSNYQIERMALGNTRELGVCSLNVSRWLYHYRAMQGAGLMTLRCRHCPAWSAPGEARSERFPAPMPM